MRDTVQVPATDLAETVDKTTAALTQANKLLGLAKLVILGALAVCLVVCFAIWNYWRVAAPWTLEKIGTQEYRMLDSDWTQTCPF